jgi:hypothetical protein
VLKEEENNLDSKRKCKHKSNREEMIKDKLDKYYFYKIRNERKKYKRLKNKFHKESNNLKLRS